MLTGKLAVVSGGGGGIGRAIAHQFARAGAAVVVTDLNKNSAQATCNSLPKVEHMTHSSIHCDVSGEQFVQQLQEFVHMQYKTAPNILVNNAGITMDARLHRMAVEQFDWVIATNLKSVFLMTRIFSQAMIDAKLDSASIINISSLVGKTGNFGQANYAASKAGVIGLTKTCAIELASNKIRVNAILPGFIETPMTAKMPPKVIEKMRSLIPIGRLGQPDDIANACMFLASDMSSYVTGAQIEVTGGMGM